MENIPPDLPFDPREVRYNELPFSLDALKEFAKLSDRIGRGKRAQSALDETTLLASSEHWSKLEPPQLKFLLVGLALVATPKTYSKIKEIAAELSEGELLSFAHIAQNIGQMKLESDLLGEPMMAMVASPLGGVGRRLRAYFAVISNDKIDEPRFRLARAAFEDACRELDGVLESIEWTESYILACVLAPFDVTLKDLIERGLEECPFLRKEFFATNLERPSDATLLEWKAGRLELPTSSNDDEPKLH